MCVRLIRRNMPEVKLIQSFADERCGGWGIVYQAANFRYYRYHHSTFYLLDGEWYHHQHANYRCEVRRNEPRAKRLQSNLHRAEKKSYRQFRYILWLDERLRNKCRLREFPYPKWYDEAQAGEDTERRYTMTKPRWLREVCGDTEGEGECREGARKS